MIYFKAYTVKLSYLLMIIHYFQLLITLIAYKLNNDLIRYRIGCAKRNCLLILAKQNQLRKLYSFKKLKTPLTQSLL